MKQTITVIEGTGGALMLEADGRTIACRSAKNIGSKPGIYWFNTNQNVMSREAAEAAFAQYVAPADTASDKCANGNCSLRLFCVRFVVCHGLAEVHKYPRHSCRKGTCDHYIARGEKA